MNDRRDRDDPSQTPDLDGVRHERAGREAAKRESWLTQLCRALRLSRGRPRPGPKR
jgi:hypothetical protein